jgi:hypothetical protein
LVIAEAAGEKLDETDGSAPNHLKLQEIGSTPPRSLSTP